MRGRDAASGQCRSGTCMRSAAMPRAPHGPEARSQSHAAQHSLKSLVREGDRRGEPGPSIPRCYPPSFYYSSSACSNTMLTTLHYSRCHFTKYLHLIVSLGDSDEAVATYRGTGNGVSKLCPQLDRTPAERNLPRPTVTCKRTRPR